MEHRDELEQLLLAGLPDAERELVINAMNRITAEKLRRKRAGAQPAAAAAVSSPTQAIKATKHFVNHARPCSC